MAYGRVHISREIPKTLHTFLLLIVMVICEGFSFFCYASYWHGGAVDHGGKSSDSFQIHQFCYSLANIHTVTRWPIYTLSLSTYWTILHPVSAYMLLAKWDQTRSGLCHVMVCYWLYQRMRPICLYSAVNFKECKLMGCNWNWIKKICIN